MKFDIHLQKYIISDTIELNTTYDISGALSTVVFLSVINRNLIAT